MKKFFYAIAAISLSLGVTACSSDDDKMSDDDEINQGSGSMSQYSPEESKEFLEEVATKALNMLNPNDQKEIIELSAYFIEEYGDLELPENFMLEDNYVTNFFKSMKIAAESNNFGTTTRATEEYVYSLNFNNCKGVYEPGRYQWVYKEASNDIVFRFTDSKGQNCELRAKGSSNNYTTSFEWEDEWDENTKINIQFPGQVDITLKGGNTELLTAKVVSNIDFGGHNFNVSVTGKFANVDVTAQMSGNNSKVDETFTVYLNGQKYLSSKANLSGNHLFDIPYWNKYANRDKEEERFNEMFKKGEGTINVLDAVNVDLYYKWVNGLSNLWFYHENANLSAKDYEDIYNEAFNANVRYNNTATVQASIKWEVTPVDYDYFEVQPVIVFADGSPYYFDVYFDTDFNGVENLFTNLIKKYEALIRAAVNN